MSVLSPTNEELASLLPACYTCGHRRWRSSGANRARRQRWTSPSAGLVQNTGLVEILLRPPEELIWLHVHQQRPKTAAAGATQEEGATRAPRPEAVVFSSQINQAAPSDNRWNVQLRSTSETSQSVTLHIWFSTVVQRELQTFKDKRQLHPSLQTSQQKPTLDLLLCQDQLLKTRSERSSRCW